MSEILIDIQKVENLHSGLGQFMLHLSKSLMSLNSAANFIFFLKSKDKDKVPSHFKLKFSTQSLQKWGMSIGADKNVIHATHQESKLVPFFGNHKVILTIHDLNFLYKKYSPLKKQIKLWKIQRKIDKATVVTFISNFTKTEVEQNLNLIGKHTQVIYNGVDVLLENPTQPEWMSYVGDYIFSLALITEKKNFHVILNILKNQPKLFWVLAGSKSSNYARFILSEAEKMGLDGRVIMPGVIDDNDKSWLYKNCLAFCFPSLSEGFGLPVVEAMQAGKPVFLSNKTSLPEIGGKEAFYWDNFEESAMNKVFNEGMQKYNTDADMKLRLQNWAAQFSWQNAANAYNKLYIDLMNK